MRVELTKDHFYKTVNKCLYSSVLVYEDINVWLIMRTNRITLIEIEQADYSPLYSNLRSLNKKTVKSANIKTVRPVHLRQSTHMPIINSNKDVIGDARLNRSRTPGLH